MQHKLLTSSAFVKHNAKVVMTLMLQSPCLISEYNTDHQNIFHLFLLNFNWYHFSFAVLKLHSSAFYFELY